MSARLILVPCLLLACGLAACGGSSTGNDESAVEPATTTRERAAAEAEELVPADVGRLRRAMFALTESGLRADDQENGQDACAALGCTARIRSDQVNLTAWRSAAAARAVGSDRRVGRFTLTFSVSRVPRSEWRRYVDVVTREIAPSSPGADR